MSPLNTGPSITITAADLLEPHYDPHKAVDDFVNAPETQRWLSWRAWRIDLRPMTQLDRLKYWRYRFWPQRKA